MNAIDPSLLVLSPATLSPAPVDPGTFPSPELAALVQQFKDAVAAQPAPSNPDLPRATDTEVSESFSESFTPGLPFPRASNQREPEPPTLGHRATPFPTRDERQPHTPTGRETVESVPQEREPRVETILIPPLAPVPADRQLEPLAQADVVHCPQVPQPPHGFHEEPQPLVPGAEKTVAPRESPVEPRISWPRDESHVSRNNRDSEVLIAPPREEPLRATPTAPHPHAEFRAPGENEPSPRVARAPQIVGHSLAATAPSFGSIPDSPRPFVPAPPSGESTFPPVTPPAQQPVSQQPSTDTAPEPAFSELDQPVSFDPAPSRPAPVRHEFAAYEPAALRQPPAAHGEAPRTIAPRDEAADTRVPDSTDDESPLGVTMLQTLLSHSSSAPTPIAPTEAAAPTAPAPRLEAVIAETVSRILVSDPLHDARREVRIEIAPDVLPDTEVRLWREEGRLHVEFISSASVADRGLRDALPNLGTTIQQRQAEQELPLVSLRIAQAGTGHQPGDGRSRQQYVPFGDAEENA